MRFGQTPQRVFPTFEAFSAAIADVATRLEAGSAPERDERLAKVWKAVGTLGGGNHFVEIDKGDDKSVWLVIHSGSRNFGLRIATYHQKIAIAHLGKMGGLEYLEGDERDQYVADMKVAQVYAALNRRVMAHVLLDYFDQKLADTSIIESVHNYINFEDSVIRKGAISAHAGEKVIIPLTMADGCIIGTGKGIEDWNFSAPHGAGRVMSRRKAKETLDLDHYRKVMREAHVWSSCVCKDTLDEAPMVYKRPKGIVESIQETVDVEMVMKPIYNFKAGGE
jgi:RNA-splicing ligase RtcB